VLLLAVASGCGLETQGIWSPPGDAEVEGPHDIGGDVDVPEDAPDVDVPVTCGNGAVDPGEDCDDGNVLDGDGCETSCRWTCRGDPDCDDGGICNGTEWCDFAWHGCMPGSNLPTGADCDDGQFCTAASTCDGAGSCVGAGNPCDDGIECTRDDCDESADACDNGVHSGTCRIDGACRVAGEASPSDGCLVCEPGASTDAWTPAADRSACTDGAGLGGWCCAGTCRAGAQCCDATDCAPGCSGTAQECNVFIDGSTCTGQRGCVWSEGSGCNGVPRACNTLDADACGHCRDGCSWSSGGCGGTAGSCTSYTSTTDCSHCGCAWGIYAYCSGAAAACSSFGDEGSCLNQTPCVWGSRGCGGDFRCY